MRTVGDALSECSVLECSPSPVALQWIHLAYFFLGFFVDIMPHSRAKVLLQDFVDVLFTTVTFPMSMVRCVCVCACFVCL